MLTTRTIFVLFYKISVSVWRCMRVTKPTRSWIYISTCSICTTHWLQ